MQSCLVPSGGFPGDRIVIVGTLAYRVVWNPRVPYPGDRNRYRRGFKTITLVNLRHARQRVSFEVPNVAAGVYPVVIYDGAEGGVHYTWNVFRVKRRT
jgi:hypothetical protein